MALVTWRDDYRVGVAVVDLEHQYLFSVINEFHDAYASGQSARDLSIVLTRLVAYAERHFQHEEALMAQAKYPHLGHHALEHEQLYSSIYRLNEKLARTGASVDRDTMRFLRHWLLDHILQEDMLVGDYLRAKSARGGKREEKQANSRAPGPRPSGEALEGATGA